jgi:predicted RecB family nuclease
MGESSRQLLSPAGLAWAVRCTRRIWLERHAAERAHADLPAEGRERAGWAADHRAALVATLFPQAASTPADSPSALAETLALLVAGVPAIRQGLLAVPLGEHLLLRGFADLLLRDDRPSRLGPWSYRPLLIKLHHEPRPEDWLQLDACRRLVAEVQGWLPQGELWLGGATGGPARRLERAGPPSAFERAWQQVERLHAEAAAPPPWFDRSCVFCRWHRACLQDARAGADLALLPGLERASAARLRRAGIDSLSKLARAREHELSAALPQQPPPVQRRLVTAAEALSSGRALPLRAAAPHPDAGHTPLVLDIETAPTGGAPWAFGWMRPGEPPQIAVVAQQLRTAPAVPAGGPAGEGPGAQLHFVATPAEAWLLIAASARSARGPLLHWGDTERTYLRRHAPEDARALLLPRLRDAQRALTTAYALPLPRTPTERGGSLKAVAAWLGYRWPAGAGHWRDGWEAFQRWQAAPADIQLLAPAIDYLVADLRALILAWQWLLSQK